MTSVDQTFSSTLLFREFIVNSHCHIENRKQVSGTPPLSARPEMSVNCDQKPAKNYTSVKSIDTAKQHLFFIFVF